MIDMNRNYPQHFLPVRGAESIYNCESYAGTKPLETVAGHYVVNAVVKGCNIRGNVDLHGVLLPKYCMHILHRSFK